MNRPPEMAGNPAWWSWFGSILPRSIREGVYEPAYLDLWRSVAAQGRPSRGRAALASLRVTGYLLASFGYSIPRYLRPRRRSEAGIWMRRVTVVVATVGALLFVLLPWLMGQLGYAY